MSEAKIADRELVLRLCRSGQFTLAEIGKMCGGITRERVRQIYKKMTGSPYRVHINAIRARNAAKKEKYLDSVSFHCQRCKRPVLHRGRTRGGKKFCLECSHLRKSKQLNLNITNICKTCYMPFHPHPGTPNQKYHNRNCYLQSRTFKNNAFKRVLT